MRKGCIERSTGSATAKTRLVAAPFTEEEIERIDDVRFGRRLLSRVETVRFLVEKGHAALLREQAVG